MARLFDDAQFDYCETDDNLSVTGPPFWISAWIYPDAAVDQTIWFLGDKDALSEYHALKVAQNRRVLAVSSNNPFGAASAETVAIVTLNVWQHVMAVWAAEDHRRVYLNGAGWSNYAARSVTGLDRTSVGRHGDSTPDCYFSGRIAETAVGTGTPTDTQVAAIAAGFDPRLVLPRVSMRAVWRFLQDDHDLFGDYDLTPYNNPSWAEHPPIICPRRPQVTVRGALGPFAEPPYRAVAGQAWHTGAAAGLAYVTGQHAGQTYTSGQTAGRIHA